MNKNLGLDNCSWALNSEQGILVNGNVEYKLEQQVQEGDIIVSIDCSVLRSVLFYIEHRLIRIGSNYAFQLSL